VTLSETDQPIKKQEG